MPKIDLSMLNQRQTPAFYADVLANRPAAGFIGRIFVSTNTYAFYRDNGTGWDLIGGPGTGTVTGSGTAGQVTYWDGASSITGSNDLFWDATNGHFGVNTNTPGTALDVHHDQSTVGILNQTVATNDTRIAFQNSGVAKWRVGNFYNLGSNDYAVNDATLNINRFTVKSSSGQTFVGDETTSSGLFVVNNSSGDAHIVALGATAPSIRVRNAGVGASLQFGLGLATTTNNFIQGATGGEFCIFNDSLTAQPILFGIKDAGLGNTQEAARISAARNFLVGTTTDAGYKLNVNGTALFSGNVRIDKSNPLLVLNDTSGLSAQIGSFSNNLNLIDNATGTKGLVINLSTGAATFSDYIYLSKSDSRIIGGNGSGRLILANSDTSSYVSIYGSSNGNSIGIISNTYVALNSGASYGETMRASSSNNVLIGTTTDNGNKLQVNGDSYVNGNVLIGTNTSVANYRMDINGNAGGIFSKCNSAGDAQYLSYSSTIGFHYYALTTGAVFYVLTNGDVRNANNSYGAISDISIKENIVDATPKLNDLLKVKIRNYNLINDENKQKQIGVIAQELEQIFPNLISNDKQLGTDETIKTVKYSVFVPMIIKAIQELNTKIENLK